jgi:hypothetical protein
LFRACCQYERYPQPFGVALIDRGALTAQQTMGQVVIASSRLPPIYALCRLIQQAHFPPIGGIPERIYDAILHYLGLDLTYHWSYLESAPNPNWTKGRQCLHSLSDASFKRSL